MNGDQGNIYICDVTSLVRTWDQNMYLVLFIPDIIISFAWYCILHVSQHSQMSKLSTCMHQSNGLKFSDISSRDCFKKSNIRFRKLLIFRKWLVSDEYNYWNWSWNSINYISEFIIQKQICLKINLTDPNLITGKWLK